LETGDRYSGSASLLVAPGQRYDERIPGWFFPIVEKPSLPGQYRFLRFAWKKRGGNQCAMQFASDGAWEKDGKGWRFFAGTGSPWPSARVLAGAIPDRWQVHTVDLFKEFGPMVITGLAVSPNDGEFMLLDHVYLARTLEDLARVPTPGK
jgi:hypothetical protein